MLNFVVLVSLERKYVIEAYLAAPSNLNLGDLANSNIINSITLVAMLMQSDYPADDSVAGPHYLGLGICDIANLNSTTPTDDGCTPSLVAMKAKVHCHPDKIMRTVDA